MKKRIVLAILATALLFCMNTFNVAPVLADTVQGSKQLFHLAVENQLFGSYDWGGSGISYPSNSMAAHYNWGSKTRNDLYNGGGWNSSGNVIKVKNYISVKSLGDVYMDANTIFGGRGESNAERKVQLWKIGGVSDNNNNAQITSAMANQANWRKVAEVTVTPDKSNALDTGKGFNWTNLTTPVLLKPNEVYVVLVQQGAGYVDGASWGNPRPNEINNVLAIHPDNIANGSAAEIASNNDFYAGGATIGIFNDNPTAYVNGVMGQMYSGGNLRYDVVAPPASNEAKQLYHFAIENQLYGSYNWGGSGVAFPENSMAARYSWGAKTKEDLYNGGGFSSSGNIIRVKNTAYIKSLGDVYMDATSVYGNRDESRFSRKVQLWKINGVADNTNETQIRDALINQSNWSKVTEVSVIPNKEVALGAGKGFNWTDLESPVLVRPNEVYVIIVEQGVGAAYGVWGNPRPNELNNVLAIHPDNISSGVGEIANSNDFAVSGATIGIFNDSPTVYGYGVMGQMYSGGNFKYDYSASNSVSFGQYIASTENGRITNINPGTSLLNVSYEIKGSQNIEFKYFDGSIINDYTKKIGTGMKVEVTAAEGVSTYTVLIMYDVNGDGDTSILDLIKMRGHLTQKDSITDIYETAGDIDNNGSISLIDLLEMKDQLLSL